MFAKRIFVDVEPKNELTFVNEHFKENLWNSYFRNKSKSNYDFFLKHTHLVLGTCLTILFEAVLCSFRYR